METLPGDGQRRVSETQGNGDDPTCADAVPMQRIGQASEVASAVLWLLSTQSAYVTGSSISVDGGMNAG